MRDASKTLRIAIVDALAALSVVDDLGRSFDVPVYDGQAPDNAPFPRMVITSISGPGGSSRFSKCQFGGSWSVQMKASMFYQGDSNTNLVDDISDAVAQILCPRRPPFMYVGPVFNIWNVDLTPGPHQRYVDTAGSYIDKNITLTYSLTQN